MALLAKLDDLKARLGISDTDSDALLTEILARVSSAFDAHTSRTLLYVAADQTEVFDGGDWDLGMSAWPITSIVSVKEASDRDFDVADALTEDEDYIALAARGILTRLPEGLRWLSGRQVIQVIYRGGHVDPVVDPLPTGTNYVPEHIQQAALLQAHYEWQRRDGLGAASLSLTGPGGGASQSKEYGLLAEVKAMLRSEVRR